MGCSLLRQAGDEERSARAAVRADLIQLACRQPRVCGDRPRIELACRKQERGKRNAVLACNHDPVTGPDSAPDQLLRNQVDSVGEFAIRPGSIALDERSVIGRLADEGLIDLVDAPRQLLCKPGN